MDCQTDGQTMERRKEGRMARGIPMDGIKSLFKGLPYAVQNLAFFKFFQFNAVL